MKEMAIRSSILAWKTPWTGEPGRITELDMTKHAGTAQFLFLLLRHQLDTHLGYFIYFTITLDIAFQTLSIVYV